MKFLHLLKDPRVRFSFSIVYALGNLIMGCLANTWWFITLGMYYAVLAGARFWVYLTGKATDKRKKDPARIKRITGIILVALSFCLIGMNILAALKDRGKVLREIIMIAIATYTFTRITLTVISMIRLRQKKSYIRKSLVSINFADALVSVCTLQRSMLVSFPGMEPAEIQLFNILTGSAVWLTIALLGVNLIGGKIVNMAKAKIVETGEKIGEAVTTGYKKIETGVVNGYKSIEKGVVSGYTKIEDKFVATYLAKEGETVEEAKERLKKEK